MGIFKPNVEKLKSKNDIPGLVNIVVRNKDPLIRAEAARALGELRSDNGSLELSEALLQDNSSVVRKSVAEALGKMRYDGNSGWAGRALLHASVKDTNPEVRTAALNALVTLPSEAIANVIAIVRDHLSEKDDPLGWRIGFLGEIASKLGQNVKIDWQIISGSLISAGVLNEDPHIQKMASDSLVKIGEPVVSSLNERILNLRGKNPQDSITRVEEEAISILRQIGSEQAIEVLRQTAFGRDSSVQKAAAQALSKLKYKASSHAENALHFLALGDVAQAISEGAQDIDGLIIFLQGHQYVHGVLRLLGRIGNPSAVNPIIEILKFYGSSWEISNFSVEALMSIEALIKIGHPAKDAVIRMLTEQSISLRQAAVEILGSIATEDHTIVELLVNLLKADTALRIRAIAANALNKLGWNPASETELAYYLLAVGETDKLGIAAVDPLISYLQLRRVEVGDVGFTAKMIASAAAALGQIGDARAIQPLLQLFINVATQFDDWTSKEIRIQVVKALGRIAAALGEIGDVDLLLQLFENVAQFNDRESSKEIQIQVVKALGRIGDARSVMPLIELLKNVKYDMRRNVADALAIATREWSAVEKLGSSAREALVRSLETDDVNILKEIIPLVAKLRNPAVVAPLGRALGVLISSIRTREDEKDILGALVKLGNRVAIEPILKYAFSHASRYNPWFECADLPIFLGDYFDIVADCCSYEAREVSSGSDAMGNQWETYAHDTYRARGAVLRLCHIQTPLANNLLHLVAEMRDIEVVVSYSCGSSSTGKLSFEGVREVARQELARRGNPLYDPAAYLDEAAYKLQ